MERVLAIVLYGVGFIVVSLAGYAIVEYVIPWLKNILGDSTFTRVLTQVQLFMTAAEQSFGKHTGKEKADWVIEQVVKMFPKLNREYVKSLIEGSMKALTDDGLINYKDKVE